MPRGQTPFPLRRATLQHDVVRELVFCPHGLLLYINYTRGPSQNNALENQYILAH